MGQLSGHPHIVNIFQVGTTATGRPYIVMQYHPHGRWRPRSTTPGPVDWRDALHIGVKVAGALETAHRRGTLHRDVKPANILLTDYGEPQLTDFGIARISGGFETADGLITGSPAYTAPEMLHGQPPAVTSDVYSLASTLFCAGTGHAVFERREGEQMVAQFLRITKHPLPNLRDSGLPADVSAVSRRCPATRRSGRRLRRSSGAAARGAAPARHPGRRHACTHPGRGDGYADPDAVDGHAASDYPPRTLTPPTPATRFRCRCRRRRWSTAPG